MGSVMIVVGERRLVFGDIVLLIQKSRHLEVEIWWRQW